MPKEHTEKKIRAIAGFKSGMTIREISEDIGSSGNSIRSWLRAEGLDPLQSADIDKKRKIEKKKKLMPLLRKLKAKGWSSRMISEHPDVDIAGSTISAWLRENSATAKRKDNNRIRENYFEDSDERAISRYLSGQSI